MVFNTILCYVSPKIVIFQELLIVETQNKCHWIQHVLNPKYALLKPFWCIFPTQNQQNLKILPESVIFLEPLIAQTWNKCSIGFSMPQTLNTCNTQALLMLFSNWKSTKYEILAVSLTPPDKTWKPVNVIREKCI